MSVSPRPLESIRQQARDIWGLTDPSAKCEQTRNLWMRVAPEVSLSDLDVTVSITNINTRVVDVDDLQAGRPDKPGLVAPSRLAQRKLGHARGRAAMLHAIAHIEFNAINLALDAVWRYDAMPEAFLADWLSVAADEARHFTMLTDEMASSGIHYGDFDAHDGLWDMARKTAPELLARMALVPRVLEARGLDATPQIQRKLASQGDQIAIEILQVILDDEIRHVRVGDYWFRALCALQELDPETTYRELFDRFEAPMPAGKLNTSARLAAGFTAGELQWLGGS